MLAATGAQTADANVRQELGEEIREARKRKSYADTVLFWRGRKEDSGTPLDPGEEAQRVNTTLPKSDAAQQQPVIQRAEPGQPEPAPKVETKKEDEKAKDDDSGGWFDWF